METSTSKESAMSYDELIIKIDKALNTLESNYYINKVCLSYSKLICLNEICFALLNDKNIMCEINEYVMGGYNTLLDELGANDSVYIGDENIRWFHMYNYEEARTFFKLFDVLEMPLIYIKSESSENKWYGNSLASYSFQKYLIHDYNINSLKIEMMKHFCPPQYFVKALRDILDYLITNKRTEELHKIEMCIKQQEFLYKDVVLVEKVVNVSRALNDDKLDGRIKLYLLNSLQTILIEQEKLHERMGVAPTINHLDLFA